MFFISQQGSTKAVTLAELQSQSSALQQQINANNDQARQLATQANTIQNQIAILNLQISQLQTQMQLTQDKLAALQVSLNKAQADLNTQKGLLKASLDQLYEMSDASTLELLIGSDSFTQFINEQTYMETLKNGIQASTEKVIALKQQIQAGPAADFIEPDTGPGSYL